MDIQTPLSMAASLTEERAALLGGDEEQSAWEAVEEAWPPRSGPSIAELVEQTPAAVVRTLQRTGVQEVARFAVPVSRCLLAFVEILPRQLLLSS